ncbi:hypothetical protein GLAREA_08277 [Glarea lozoyensis ATCC 20868]|uniref:Uncharacterized protein n=1 Tax=Glarea lozoyensis (strain ATCC 20868 / MF5171) TaxID=1116229 RepID=S3CEJ2_GLAL2|nr:uncharacterized protein GLAREA_08277 [Glarea lozoyensis ATCC 20868]EPE24425.1 hypothetical protein GLAREA_08277 [Glarea lozoyensis ATCC 20868]
MNTSMSDDEFDNLLTDDNLNKKNAKSYLQKLPHVAFPKWHPKSWKSHDIFLLHPSFQLACLVANVVGLSIIAFSFTFLFPNLKNQGQHCVLATDKLLGEDIGWNTILWEDQPDFVNSDPDGLDHSQHSKWSDIYPSSWIWVPQPSNHGYGGGVKLIDHAVHPEEFEDTTEGFSVSVMHQVHCVAELKRALIQYRKDGVTQIADEHLDHCTEYLRQAVICHADLTLERPENMTFPQGSTGWGDMHRCRDWDAVLKTIQDHSIGWVDNERERGWKKRNFVDGELQH